MNPQQPIEYNQPTAAPTPKVAAVGISGAVLTIVTILAAVFNITLPPAFSDNIAQIVAGAVALTSLIQFAAGYLKRDAKPPAAVEEIVKEETLYKG